ncbi:MAG: tripartite tricarboxylate transporter substrate binding protein [Hyphomicrobiaceae bacterium]|nr:tripartite tricarboxylate transporter substrate binding protein [Hyphomicrobiaceae bacterium]
MAPRRRFTLGLAGIVTAAMAAAAVAYPTKSVDYIIPFGPGGESDITARLQQPFFKTMFGQDLVVSYKPGGGGAVGWAELNNLPGDGHTIMGVNLPHIVLQPAQKKVGYTTEDLTTVYWFHFTPDAIVVKDDSPYKTLKDLIEYAKANPGKVTLSGSGKGTANHLAQVRFDKMAGIKTTYVSFAGTGPSNTALLGGQTTAAWGYTTSAAALGEKARILAVAMDKRHPKYPDVPTFKELGFDLVSGAYRGIAVPKSTPEDTRKKLSEMIGKINADPQFQKRMLDGGFAMLDIPYEKNAEFMKARSAEFIEAAKEGGILN